MRFVVATLLTVLICTSPVWALFESDKMLAKSAKIPMDQVVEQPLD